MLDALPPARILVVDDDLHTRELLRELCESQGHHVEIAADGPSALAAVEKHRPDLVLLDVMLPGIDGFGVLSQLRAHPEFARLPVIILTAGSDLNGKIRGIELGATDYITKPFRLFELTTRLRSALTMRQYVERLQVAEAEIHGQGGADDARPTTGGYPQVRTGLGYELARAKRYNRPLALLLLCVENFDGLRGRLARNEVERFTREISGTLRAGLRETDRLFRIDLDEFVVLLPETDTQGAETARNRVLETFGKHPAGLQVSVGVGVAADAEKATPEEMMRAAQRDLEARHKR